MRAIKYLLVSMILWTSCTTSQKDDTTADNAKSPKYVFYFIGDGYGPAQAELAQAYTAQLKGNIIPDTLLMNTFKAQGTYATYAENRYITGSAAAGTALAAGRKTSINSIGMSHNHEEKFNSIAELLKKEGMKVGIVTSVSIDHATPAAFYAHQPHRGMYYEISLDLPKSGFNYFAGGGFKDPYGKKRKTKASALSNMGLDSKAKKEVVADTISVYEVGKQMGYRFVNTKEDFNNLKKGDDKIVVATPKPAGGAALPYAIDLTDENFTLADYTRKGIELLENPKGFFMMIEGGKIDWACHANDVAATAHEVLDFDKAVKEAYEFYKKYPEETLIVICSDHETGGLTLGATLTHYETYYELIANQKCSNEFFTNIIEDYKAKHNGRYTYNAIYPLLKKYYGFDTSEAMKLNAYNIADLKQAVKDDLNMTYDARMENPRKECDYGPYSPVATVAAHILAQKAGIGWTTYSHTALPCPSRAIGVGAENFYGAYNNTDLPLKILKLYGIEINQ